MAYSFTASALKVIINLLLLSFCIPAICKRPDGVNASSTHHDGQRPGAWLLPLREGTECACKALQQGKFCLATPHVTRDAGGMSEDVQSRVLHLCRKLRAI